MEIIRYLDVTKYLNAQYLRRERENDQRGKAKGEGEADSPPSKDPNVGLSSRTLGSWPGLKADT